MRRTVIKTTGIVLIVLVSIVGLSLTGCNAIKSIVPGLSPTTQPVSATTNLNKVKQGYTAALNVLIDARKLGQITDAQYVKIDAARKDARAAINAAEIAVKSGGLNASSLIDQAQAALDKFIDANAQIKSK